MLNSAGTELERDLNTESPVYYGVEVGGQDIKQVSVRGSKHACRCVWEQEASWVSGSETVQRLKDQKKYLILYTERNREPMQLVEYGLVWVITLAAEFCTYYSLLRPCTGSL